MNSATQDLIRSEILELVGRHHRLRTVKPFVPGETFIPYSGRIYDEQEVTALVDSALDFWLTAGLRTEEFEERMRSRFESRDFLLVNSGSSANLLMVATLCSPEVEGHLNPGDEVITPAVTFPTTVAPIIQNRLVPVFVDCEVETLNIDPALVEDAIGPRTRALFIPHTLGNPCDMEAVCDIANRHDLRLLEDSCDALGARFSGKPVGTFGDMASLSFYPAHQMTMGEGGGVIVNGCGLQKAACSIRDWGRSCWCNPGKSNTCGKRFAGQSGELPEGYDHKYTYSNIGYNLKATDMQAAVGLAQLDKVDGFIESRRRTFGRLLAGLQSFAGRIILPRIDPRAEPSPFGFPVTVRPGIDRNLLVRHLEAARIETRLLFGGNITKQPGFLNIEKRIHGELTNSNIVMRDTLFVGVYPGLTDEMIDYMLETFHRFFEA